MTEKIYFIENTNALEDALEMLINAFPCFVEREFVEMNFSKITVRALEINLASVERILAPVM